MKKTLICAILAALVIAPVAAFEVTGVGITTGYNLATRYTARLTGTFNFDAKNEGYIQLGCGATRGIEVFVGYDYVIDAFKVEKEKINIKLGAQAGAYIFNSTVRPIGINANATAALSYNFKIEKARFNTFLRLGVGAFLMVDTEDGLEQYASIFTDLGLIYKF